MIINILETKKEIYPFEENMPDVCIGNTTIRQFQLFILSQLKIPFKFIKDLSEVSENSDTLLIFDNVFFSKYLLKSFLNGIDKSRLCQCFTAKNFFTWCYELNAEPKFDSVSIFYIPKGNKLEQEKKKICVLPKISHKHPFMFPSKIFNSKDLYLPFSLIYGFDIEIWPDILLANSLVCRHLCLQRLQYLEKIVLKSKLIQKIVGSDRLMEHVNRKGKNCNLHPTALIEGSLIGNNVRIGAYSRIRTSIIGDNSHVTDGSIINLSSIGKNSYVTRAEMFNSFIGNDSFVVVEKLFNSIIGSSTFIGGQTSFADFNINGGLITTKAKPDEEIKTPYIYLGCLVGNNVSMSGSLAFSPGTIIPHNSHHINNFIIKDINSNKDNITFVYTGDKVTKVPKSFIK